MTNEMSYVDLQIQIKKLQDQAEQVRASELAAIIADTKAKIAQYGLTAKQLGLATGETSPRGPKPKASGKTGKSTVAPKYKGPQGQLWSGRGRAPLWTLALPAGKTLADYAIA